VNKLKLIWALSPRLKLLYLEAIIYLGMARILKAFSFSRVGPTLGEQGTESSFTLSNTTIRSIMQISEAVQIMSKYTFWESQCLVKAIAAMKMLERRRIESTLYLGVGKDEQKRLIAHAWLRSGDYYLTGSEGMEKFTVVGSFAYRCPDKRLKGEKNG
jgi:hypothetical protein